MSHLIPHRPENHILLPEIGQVLPSDIDVNTLETTGHLKIQQRIYRSQTILIQQITGFIRQVFHKIVHPRRSVDRSSEIEDPFVQVCGILKIQHPFVAACHRLLHQSSALQFHLSICVAESCRNGEPLNRLHGEIHLVIVRE